MSEISKCLDYLPLGVYVIGTDDGKNGNLMTAVWLTEVTGGSDPRIAVSIGETHITNEFARAAQKFAVSVLSSEQIEIGKQCGFNSGKKTDKTALVANHKNKRGLPVIDDAAAYFDCDVESVLKVGDHYLIIAKVIDGCRDKNKSMQVYNFDTYFG